MSPSKRSKVDDDDDVCIVDDKKPATMLEDLPNEVLFKIMSSCPAKTLITLEGTSKRFRALVPGVFEKMRTLDVRGLVANYRAEYQQKKRMAETIARCGPDLRLVIADDYILKDVLWRKYFVEMIAKRCPNIDEFRVMHEGKLDARATNYFVPVHKYVAATQRTPKMRELYLLSYEYEEQRYGDMRRAEQSLFASMLPSLRKLIMESKNRFMFAPSHMLESGPKNVIEHFHLILTKQIMNRGDLQAMISHLPALKLFEVSERYPHKDKNRKQERLDVVKHLLYFLPVDCRVRVNYGNEDVQFVLEKVPDRLHDLEWHCFNDQPPKMPSVDLPALTHLTLGCSTQVLDLFTIKVSAPQLQVVHLFTTCDKACYPQGFIRKFGPTLRKVYVHCYSLVTAAVVKAIGKHCQLAEEVHVLERIKPLEEGETPPKRMQLTEEMIERVGQLPNLKAFVLHVRENKRLVHQLKAPLSERRPHCVFNFA